MQDKIDKNPYTILGVSPLASNAEIAKAFGLAMKERKYSPDEIAKARKSLMNPDERIIADYLSPVIPLVKRFRLSDFSDRLQIEDSVEEQLTPEQIDRLIQIEIDKLERDEPDIDLDRELASLVWD